MAKLVVESEKKHCKDVAIFSIASASLVRIGCAKIWTTCSGRLVRAETLLSCVILTSLVPFYRKRTVVVYPRSFFFCAIIWRCCTVQIYIMRIFLIFSADISVIFSEQHACILAAVGNWQMRVLYVLVLVSICFCRRRRRNIDSTPVAIDGRRATAKQKEKRWRRRVFDLREVVVTCRDSANEWHSCIASCQWRQSVAATADGAESDHCLLSAQPEKHLRVC